MWLVKVMSAVVALTVLVNECRRATAIPGCLPGRQFFLVYVIPTFSNLTDPLPRNERLSL